MFGSNCIEKEEDKELGSDCQRHHIRGTNWFWSSKISRFKFSTIN